jgi:sec-independent protein translocase protein TatB
MFDIGFSEVLLIFVIALVVLGPEKLPRAASQVGRWVGRARAMARQFKEQLEEEVNLENVRKAHKEAAAKEEAASSAAATAAGVAGTTTATGEPQTGTAAPAEVQPHDAMQAVSSGTDYAGPDPADFRADTFSHAHPTNEYGANPLTANGGPPVEPTPPASEAGASAEAHAAPTTPSPPPAANEPVREPVPVTPIQSDNHGHS